MIFRFCGENFSVKSCGGKTKTEKRFLWLNFPRNICCLISRCRGFHRHSWNMFIPKSLRLHKSCSYFWVEAELCDNCSFLNSFHRLCSFSIKCCSWFHKELPRILCTSWQQNQHEHKCNLPQMREGTNEDKNRQSDPFSLSASLTSSLLESRCDLWASYLPWKVDKTLSIPHVNFMHPLSSQAPIWPDLLS